MVEKNAAPLLTEVRFASEPKFLWHWTSVLVVISGFDRDGPFEVDRIFGQSGSSKKAGGSGMHYY